MDRACQLCGGMPLEEFAVPGSSVFWLCRTCELYQYGQMVDETAYAADYHSGYQKHRPRKVRTARVRLNRVASLLESASPRMLDVGCSVGATLEAARVFNWQAVGVDVSQDAVEYCQERDLNAVKVASGHLPFDDASFDLVVNWHVIEHVSDVRQTLDEWYRVLKPGGILFLETPDGASPKVRRLGKHYRKFWAPEHTYTFTYSNLAQFMCSTGFEVIPGPAVGNPFQQGLTFAPYLIADRGFKGLRKLLGVHKEFQIFGRKPAAESLLRQPTLPVAA